MKVKDLYEIETMTLFEYEARMYAFRLAELDKEHDFHLQAWLNHQVTATKKDGKPEFKNFKAFFDVGKQIKSIERELNGSKSTVIKPQHKRMANIAAEVNARGG